MIIINEENDHKYNFHNRIVNTQNNLFLCSNQRLIVLAHLDKNVLQI